MDRNLSLMKLYAWRNSTRHQLESSWAGLEEKLQNAFQNITLSLFETEREWNDVPSAIAHSFTPV
jgi:hypothetical protein